MRRRLLVPLSWLYRFAMLVRNVAYDKRLLRVHKAGVPVVCVGNISAGGTGKTPLVEEIARWVMSSGIRVGILSRGYARSTTGYVLVAADDASKVGDEPAQMSRNIPDAVIAVDEDRVEGAERLVNEQRVQAIILDDGYQHRRLARDLDIVVMTASEVQNSDLMLPAGNRREPLSALRRAGAVVITNCVDIGEFERMRSMLPASLHNVVAGVRTQVKAVHKAQTDGEESAEWLRGRSAVAFSGIGSPYAFAKTLRSLGVQLKRHEIFPDHFAYAPGDIEWLRRLFNDIRPDIMITTQKDIMRLRSERLRPLLESLPVYYTVVGPEWLSGETELRNAVLSCVR